MYQALYRKYRPRSFSDVVGQEHITETLRRQIAAGRTSHAYLFVGTRGTGKTTCAKILARALNCEHPVDGDPCNECAACRGIEDGSVMDVVEIDAASNNSVDNIRAIRDEAMYTPVFVRRRVYIIDEVHMLSTSAFNALLKILEEPPEHLVFILATTELNKVLPTIRSRCQHFSFRRISPDKIAQRLKYVASCEHFTLTDGAAKLLARLADGSMRDALSLLDQCLTGDTVDEDTVRDAVGIAGAMDTADIWAALKNNDISSAVSTFEKVYFGGAEPISVLGDILTLARDIMLRRIAPQGSAQLLSGTFSSEELDGFSANIPSNKLLAVSETLQDAIDTMKDARDKRAKSELCLIKLAGILAGSCKDSASFTPTPEAAAPAAPVRERTPEPRTAPATRPEPVPRPATPPKTSAPAPSNTAPAPSNTAPAPWEELPGEKTLPDLPPLTPAPWEDPPEEDTIKWASDEPEEAPIEDSPAPESPTAKESSPNAWWDEVLKTCSSQIGDTEFQFLSNAMYLAPELDGSHLTLYGKSEFVLLMLNKPNVISAVSQAASTILGRSINVSITVGTPKQTLKEDKLDELAKFGNIRFR